LKEWKRKSLDESLKEITMKQANLLAVLVILFIVAGCSNDALQVIPRTAASPRAGVPSFFSLAPASHPISEAPGQAVAAPVPAITETATPALLHAIAVALDDDKEQFCQYSRSANCDEDFRRAFEFRTVTLSKSGQRGFIVEVSGVEFCGSAGCAINVLKQTGDKVERTFENDEVGSLDSFEVATTVTNGFYDLTKHGSDGTDYHYSWTGSNYEDVGSPLSTDQAQAVAAASEPGRKNCRDCVTAKPVGVPFSRASATYQSEGPQNK
jgi:hypothetical protein